MAMQGMSMLQSMQGGGEKGGGEEAAPALGQSAPDTGGRGADWFKAVEGLGEKNPRDTKGI
jgi:hypothetical protein